MSPAVALIVKFDIQNSDHHTDVFAQIDRCRTKCSLYVDLHKYSRQHRTNLSNNLQLVFQLPNINLYSPWENSN